MQKRFQKVQRNYEQITIGMKEAVDKLFNE